MKLLPCPHLGMRPLSEFVYGGEVRKPPPAREFETESTEADATGEQDKWQQRWSDYVFNRRGEPGCLREWWFHRPSGQWFVLERDTATNQVLGTVSAEDWEHRPWPGNAHAKTS